MERTTDPIAQTPGPMAQAPIRALWGLWWRASRTASTGGSDTYDGNSQSLTRTEWAYLALALADAIGKRTGYTPSGLTHGRLF